MSFEIVVTDHAMWRAAERFPGFDTLYIETEVRSAMRGGRVSALFKSEVLHEPSLYVWTPGRWRTYVLRVGRPDPNSFYVITALRREDLYEQAS